MENTERLEFSRPRPCFALSMGDPAGIGPEIACKAMVNDEFAEQVMVVGDYPVMQQAARFTGLMREIVPLQTPDEFVCGAANVLDCNCIEPRAYTIGKPQASCGKAAYEYILQSIDMAMAGTVDGVITNPISKESLHAAGFHYPGHTEIFAERTNTPHFTMLFLLRDVGVAHVTTHCSLRQAIETITTKRVITHIHLLFDAMQQLGIVEPRIAVGGLNPHAGENGLFGSEELDVIIPAIEHVQGEGLPVNGPYPPDTVFMRAFRGEFDGVVAMLHDHGFVALKSMDFEHGVNITIGLPIIRTSVGHGTAFNIAGLDKASPASLLAAFDAAQRLYHNRGTGI